jgi:hypothetical protein
MVTCQTLDEARAVSGVIAIVAGNPIRAYVQGDVLPPEVTVDQAALAAAATRDSAIDANITATAIGGAQPATVAQLKGMDVATYASWFDANFTTTAQALALLKRLTLIVIRRVL